MAFKETLLGFEAEMDGSFQSKSSGVIGSSSSSTTRSSEDRKSVTFQIPGTTQYGTMALEQIIHEEKLKGDEEEGSGDIYDEHGNRKRVWTRPIVQRSNSFHGIDEYVGNWVTTLGTWEIIERNGDLYIKGWLSNQKLERVEDWWQFVDEPSGRLLRFRKVKDKIFFERKHPNCEYWSTDHLARKGKNYELVNGKIVLKRRTNCCYLVTGICLLGTIALIVLIPLFATQKI